MYLAGNVCEAYITTSTIAPTTPAMMNAHRKNEARAAEALVFASRQAIGFDHTTRGFFVRSPLLIFSFSSTHVCKVVDDCAIRRRKIIDGTISTKLRKNMNEM